MPEVNAILDINVENTQVILLGSSKFQDENLLPLPAVENNIADLKALFVRPDIIGVPESNIMSIINNPLESDSLDKIIGVLGRATDTLIFYYAGHGTFGRKNKKLYLATQTTNTATVEQTSLFSFENIWEMISSHSISQNIIFILDCCYSGRALDIPFGDRNVFVLTATNGISKAEAPIGETYTAFTSELISLLTHGTGSQKTLTLNNVYSYLKLRLESKNLPSPFASGSISQLSIIHNLGIVNKPVDKSFQLYSELKNLIEQKINILTKQLEIYPQENVKLMKSLNEVQQEYEQIKVALFDLKQKL